MPGTDSFICLMYHEIEADRPGRPVESWFSVPAGAFATQLDMLQAAGSRGCSLEEAFALPGTPRVAITFDDGNLGQYQRAVPALAARGMTATFFIVTDWVGRPGYVSWAQLREMRAAGMSIQSHTRSHPFLSECAPEAVREELGRSKAMLDDELGQDTSSLGLPNGDFPRRRDRRLIAECGYRVVATSRWGVNAEGDSVQPCEVRRCTVRGSPSGAEFSRVLARDPWLFAGRRVRESILGGIRSWMGPTRYAGVRRRVLRLLD